MPKGRLEAFSDGVIAILITIMVLELHTPVGTSWHALGHELPVLLAYALSFVYLGIYWNNHHHMLAAVSRVTGGAMWANLHLLFWLSLIPFSTAWMSEHRFPSIPTAVYGIVLLCAAIAYYILQTMLLRAEGERSVLRTALGSDVKGKISPLLVLPRDRFVVCRSLARPRRVRRRRADVASARPPPRTPCEHCSQEAKRIRRNPRMSSRRSMGAGRPSGGWRPTGSRCGCGCRARRRTATRRVGLRRDSAVCD